jgi:hypothetical protein
MSRKQRKSPQQTFEVSQEDLAGYYNRYLPEFAPGGAYRTTPYKSSAMHATTGGRLASFLDRVAGGTKDAITNTLAPKPPRAPINKRDYQRTTITNNTDVDQYYDSNDGSVETKNVAMAEGLNGWGGMDNYLSSLQEVKDLQGNPTFSQSTWNRDTGGIDYTNPDPNARTINDIANERLSGIGAQYMTFDNDGIVDTYNTGDKNVTYDPNSWSPPADESSSEVLNNNDQVISRTETTTLSAQEERQRVFCEQNPDQCPELRYGGGLPRFQGDEDSSELGYHNPFAQAPFRGTTQSTMDLDAAMTQSNLQGMNMAPSPEQESYTELGDSPYQRFIGNAMGQERFQNRDGSFPPPLETPPTPVSTTGNIGSGMFQVNQDLGLPTPPAPTVPTYNPPGEEKDEFGRTFAQQMREEGEAYTWGQLHSSNMQEPSFSDQLQELGDNNTIPGGAEKLEGPQVSNLLSGLSNQQGPQGTVEKDASWGDTFGQRVRNKFNYGKDKLLNNKVGDVIKALPEVADMAVEGAGIFNDWYGDRLAEAKEIQGISGTTTDAMAAVKSADDDGLYGQFDQNTGKLRPNDGIVSHFAKRGLEMYQDRGEFSQQPEHDTALLRQFLQMSDPTFQFSQSAIEEQKKSLGQMRNGGQVLDLDEGLIRELIAAGANIEIL